MALRLCPLLHLALLLAFYCCDTGANAFAAAEPKNSRGGPRNPRRLAQNPASRSAEVIVVGAGMAGMKAARDLVAKLGAESVIVLEGRDRVGGRAETILLNSSSGPTPVDLGASWIYGTLANPMIDLAFEAQAPLAATPTDYENSMLFLPDGKEASDISDTEWLSAFDDFRDTIYEEQYEMNISGGDPGLGFLANAFIQERGLTGLDRLAFLFNVDTEIEQEYAASVANLSLWYDTDASVAGDDTMLQGGYQRLVEHLARGIDVRLGHKVTVIDSSDPTLITVAVEGHGSITARQVVVAVPLGVLQAGTISFSPNGLPPANLQALRSLGSGLLNKVVLVFDEMFWEPDVEIINRIAPEGKGAFEETYNLYPINGKPILVGFNAADYARYLETLPAEQVKELFLAVLRGIFGAGNVPEPRSYAVTSWGRDEFSLGSYSFTRAPVAGEDGYVQAHQNCALPMASNRIFFAGEHTRTDNPATTDGAYASGQQAAADLLLAREWE